jgi:hypothetical protein
MFNIIKIINLVPPCGTVVSKFLFQKRKAILLNEGFNKFLASMPDGFIWTVVISMLISAMVSSYFRKREKKDAAQIDYDYGQKKRVKELIGTHHGRLIGAAYRFNLRMFNLYKNDRHEWIKVDGRFDDPDRYYFRSSVYRFMDLFCVLRDIEKQAILLDFRVASALDFRFLCYVNSINWLISDSELSKGSFSDGVSPERDHFYSDNVKKLCDLVMENSIFPSSMDFDVYFSEESKLDKVLNFFDGVTRSEDRDRWDRLVCLNLLLMLFLDSFGHPMHRMKPGELDMAISQLRVKETGRTFEQMLGSYGLEKDKGVALLRSKLRALK